MPKQTRSQRICRAIGRISKEMGGAVMDFAGSVFDATIGENRRQTDEFIRRTEIAELIRDASGPNINRQIIARQKPQEMGIKI